MVGYPTEAPKMLKKSWRSTMSRVLVNFNTRYTVRGRGAKRRTPSALTRTYLTRLWSKTTCIRLTAYARLRHIDENFQEVPYQGGSGGSMFVLTCCKKVPETVSRNGSLNRLIPVANANKWRVLLRPSKIHNSNHQGPATCVPPPRFSSQKVIIILTDERTPDFLVPRMEKALRAKMQWWIFQ